MDTVPQFAVVIPAAGIGKRMLADMPKQYLALDEKTVLEHTLWRFLEHPLVSLVVVALAAHDDRFETLGLASHPKLVKVQGGEERAHSVFNGLAQLRQMGQEWVMVHDAARPCLSRMDIESLYKSCIENDSAGILATPVRDTMKRGKRGENRIDHTVDRDHLWHALTPQCARVNNLYQAYSLAFDDQDRILPGITDEASVLERAGHQVLLVPGSVRNIKITHPEDLPLAKIFIDSEES